MTKRSKAALTVVLAALVLCVGGLAWSEPITQVVPNDDNAKQPEPPKALPEPGTPALRPIINAQPDYEKAEAKKSTQDGIANIDLPWYTIARLKFVSDPIAWFTLVLAIYTVGLWRSTADLAREARQSGTRQAQDSRESLELARKALEVTRDAYIASERPWVVIPNMR